MDFVPGPFRYTEIDFVDRPISLPDRATALRLRRRVTNMKIERMNHQLP